MAKIRSPASKTGGTGKKTYLGVASPDVRARVNFDVEKAMGAERKLIESRQSPQ